MFVIKRLPDEPYLSLISDSALAEVMNNSALLSPEGIEICRSLFKVILKDTALIQNLNSEQAPLSKQSTEGHPLEMLDEVIELCNRMILSLLMLSGPIVRNEQQLRSFISRRILPSIELDTP